MRVVAEPEKEQERAEINISRQEPTTDTQGPRRWFAQTESPVAWFVAINAMLQITIFAADMTTFGIYYVALCEYFDEKKATVGWIRGIQTITDCSFAIFGGALVERYGCRCGGIVSALCQFLGIGLGSLAPNIYVLYPTIGFLNGIGQSLNFLSANVIIQQHFHSNRVLGSGLGMLGMCVGGLIGPVIVHNLLETYGLRGALLIHSAISLHATVFAANYRPPVSKMTDPRRSKGNKFTCQEFICLLKAAVDFRLLRIPSFTWFCFGSALMEFGFMVAGSHVPGRAVTMGIDSDRAAYLVSVGAIGKLVLRVISMLVANHKSISTVGYFAAGSTLVGIGSLTFAVTAAYSGMLVAVMTIGAGAGCSVTILIAVLVELTSVEKLPKALGIYQLISTIGWGSGAPLAGWIYDVTGNYDLPFYISGTAGLISATVIATIAVIGHRKNSREIRRSQAIRSESQAVRQRTDVGKPSSSYCSTTDV